MPVVLALEILKLSLELTLEIVKHMPPEAHADAWARHMRLMTVIDHIFSGLVPLVPEPA